ncbi:Myb, related [Neospora caninum Liverpool]|nr:Myb, related [Neospora caninum Liverpool]CBZ52607.1 Myb, related [Neospora caninum Liverpool]|eukprot:XP_003882639.1 Myb, related [Neospora caninum Liverpool]
MSSLLANWDNARGDPGWSSAVLRWQLDRLKVKRRRRVKKEEEEDDEDAEGKTDEHSEKEEEEEGEGLLRERMAMVNLRVFKSFVRELYKTLVSIPIPEHAVRALFNHCRLHPSLSLPASPSSAAELADESFLPITPGELHPSKLLYATRSLLLAWQRLGVNSASLSSSAAPHHHASSLPSKVPSFAEVLRAVCTAVAASLPQSVSWAFTPSECLSNFVTSVQPADASISPSLLTEGSSAQHRPRDASSPPSPAMSLSAESREEEVQSADTAGLSSWRYSSFSLSSLSREGGQGADSPGHDFRLLATVEDAILRGLRQVVGGTQTGEAPDEQAAAVGPGGGTSGRSARLRDDRESLVAGEPAAALAGASATHGRAERGAETADASGGGESLLCTGRALDREIRAALARPDKVPVLYFASLLTQPVPPFAVFQVYLHLKKRSTEQHGLVCHRRWWSPEEDAALLRAVDTVGVQQRGAGKWMKVAALLPGRTNNQCRARYLYLAVEGKRHGLFSALEDLRLQVLVSCYGRGSWGKIARHLRGRTEMKCRERYENCLHDEVKSLLWTASEISLLRVAADFFHQDWQAVARVIGGRPAQHCREKFAELETQAEMECASIRFLSLPWIPGQPRDDLEAEGSMNFALHVGSEADPTPLDGAVYPLLHLSGSWTTSSPFRPAVVTWAQAHLGCLLRLFVSACPHLFPDSVREAATRRRHSPSSASLPISPGEAPGAQEVPSLEAKTRGETRELSVRQRRTDVNGTGERERQYQGIDGGRWPAEARSAAIAFARYLEGLYTLLVPASSSAGSATSEDRGLPASDADSRLLSVPQAGREAPLHQGESVEAISREPSSPSFPARCSERSQSCAFFPSSVLGMSRAGAPLPSLGDHSPHAAPPRPPASAPAQVLSEDCMHASEARQRPQAPGASRAAPGVSPPDALERPGDDAVACLFLLFAVKKCVAFGLGEHAPRLLSLYKKGVREWGLNPATRSPAEACGNSRVVQMAGSRLGPPGPSSRSKSAREIRGETVENPTDFQLAVPQDFPEGVSQPVLPDPRLPADVPPAAAVGLLRWLAFSGATLVEAVRGPRASRAPARSATLERHVDVAAERERVDLVPPSPVSAEPDEAQVFAGSAGTSERARGRSVFGELLEFVSHERGHNSLSAGPAKRPSLRCLQQRPLPVALVEAATQAAAAEMKLRGLDREPSRGTPGNGKERNKRRVQPSRSSSVPDSTSRRLAKEREIGTQGAVLGSELGENLRVEDERSESQAAETFFLSHSGETHGCGAPGKVRRYYAEVSSRHISARVQRQGRPGRGRGGPGGDRREGSDAAARQSGEVEEMGQRRDRGGSESKRGRGRGGRKGKTQEGHPAPGRRGRGRKGKPGEVREAAGENPSGHHRVEDGASDEDGASVSRLEERLVGTEARCGNDDGRSKAVERRRAIVTDGRDETGIERNAQKRRNRDVGKNRDGKEMSRRERLAEDGIAQGLPIGRAGEIDVCQMCERAVVGLPLQDGRTGKKFTEAEAYAIASEVAAKLKAMCQAPTSADQAATQ